MSFFLIVYGKRENYQWKYDRKEEKVGEHKGKDADGEMGKVNSHEAVSSGPDM